MDVFDLTAKLTLDSSEFDAGLNRAGQSADKLGKSTWDTDKAMSRLTVASAAAATAVVAFGAASVKTGMKFDSSMSQVAATMGVTVDEIGELRDFAMEMGKTTAFSATQAADALNYMALAGYDAQTSMEMLPNVLNLAAAGGIDLAYASDMITDSQSALGLSLDETNALVDQMAMAASKSNTSVAQLGEAILTVGGTAKSLSGGTTELAAALGILADNGIKGAEGGTALRNVLLGIQSDKFEKTFGELGVSAYDAGGNLRELSDILDEMNAAMEGMTDEQKTDLINKTFNRQDLKSVNALLATSTDRWNELTGAIENSAGAAEQMADTQLDNLAGDVTLLKSAFEGLQIEVSDKLTPVLRVGVQGLTELISNFGDIAGAVAPALAAVSALSSYLIVTQRLIPAIKDGLIPATKAFFGLLAANPMAIAIALMAGLAVGAYRLATHFGELYTEADAAAEGVRNLNRATESTVTAFAEADAAAGHALDTIKTKLGNIATETAARMGEGGSEGAQAYKNNLISELEAIDPEMAAVVSSAMDASAQLGGQYGAELSSEYAAGIESGSGDVNAAVSNVTGQMTAEAQAKAQEAIKAGNAFSIAVAQGATQLGPQASSAVRAVVQNAINSGKGAASGASAIGSAIASGIASGISGATGRIASSAVSAVNTALAAARAAAAIHSPSKLFRDEVGYYMGLGIAKGLEDSEDEAIKAAVKLARDTYSASQEWLRRNAKFNDWSLQQQLEVWQEIQSGFVKGSQQYLDAEEQIFDLRRDIEDEYFDSAKKAIQKDTKFKKLSLVEQLALWTELQNQYEKGTEKYAEIEEETFDLREDIQEKYRDNVEKIWDNIVDSYENYVTKLGNETSKIYNAYGLFDDVQDRFAVNGDELVTNLTRQVNVMSSFYEGLDALSERGASDDLVDEIREMGPKAVDQLQALLKMTDKQWDKYVELYEKKQELANSEALKELSGLKAETAKEIASQLEELDKLYESTSPALGETFTQSLAQGIKDGMGYVVQAATNLAKEANNAFMRTLNLSTSVGSALTKSTSFASSAVAGTSAQIVNTLAGVAYSSGGTYNINLNVDGNTVARTTFDPLKNFAASQGTPIVAAT